ncbi:unnamed protein product [Adineta ricciae]|uniref:Uncharacterized protein n=1 Tax=Adineta ricciae TaxID=249248 RepID=A0A814HFQ7_ADIRI|nr:unnamed protein product [Adineta ricciae]CAF1009568.1 unnamed protein product [Adineta ricciae]
MNGLSECRFFHRTFTFDDLSKQAPCKTLKFKRAFQFLQILLLQRVYGIDVITCSSNRRTLPKQHRCQFDVFLGGSCNPTTWRYEQAIPYFQSHSISYYNPQVPNWTPDLVEIEYRAKEDAPVLFFVIDHSTRSLAAIAEVSYLAARGRNIIVVMNGMSNDRTQVKFIREKTNSNEIDDENDYRNACEARRILRRLLQNMNVPIFDNLTVALECATFFLENSNQTVIVQEKSTQRYENKGCCTGDDTSDDFYQQVTESEMTSSSPISSSRRHSSSNGYVSPIFSPCIHSTHFTTGVQFRRLSTSTKTQISCSTNESEDDGYGSLGSSYRTLSQSSSVSVYSDVYDNSFDENMSSRFYLAISILNHIFLTVFLHISLPTPSLTQSSSLIQPISFLYKRLKSTFIPPPPSPPTHPVAPTSSCENVPLFDLYIAAGEHDQYWLKTFVVPLLDELNLKYIQEQHSYEHDELDNLYDSYIRKRSRLLFYIINDQERLSHLATELAFLMGQRQYRIIICLQRTINENCEKIRSKTERQDIARSRKYLEDIAKKENILVCQSREQSWQHVLAFLLQNSS